MKRIHAVAVMVAGISLLSGCASTPPLGQTTRTWTELQRSNVAALGWARPLPGDAADKVYQRYLNSFGQPIPDSFTRKSFTAE